MCEISAISFSVRRKVAFLRYSIIDSAFSLPQPNIFARKLATLTSSRQSHSNTVYHIVNVSHFCSYKDIIKVQWGSAGTTALPKKTPNIRHCADQGNGYILN